MRLPYTFSTCYKVSAELCAGVTWCAMALRVLMITMCVGACRGRVLRGKLVVDALLMTGIHTVLQDEQGEAINVRSLQIAFTAESASRQQQSQPFRSKVFKPGRILLGLHAAAGVQLSLFATRDSSLTADLCAQEHAGDCACQPLLPVATATAALLLFCCPTGIVIQHPWPAAGRRACYKRAFTLAQQLFPKGQAIAIIEPYYKLATDGSFLVRVDNPAEVGD